jgi:hypothetical protein
VKPASRPGWSFPIILKEGTVNLLRRFAKKAMEAYLKLFEHAVKKQAEIVGEEAALEQAKQAGLGVSPEGHIVSCTGHPQLVLLRLVKSFTAGGSLQALAMCTPLINRVLQDAEGTLESPVELGEEPVRS